MVVRAEDVHRSVEAALELVAHVRDVGGVVRVRAVGADDDAVLVVAEARRRRPDRAVLLVRLDRGEHLRHVLLDLALAAPRVDVDAEPLERRLDRLAHRRDGIVSREVAEVVAVVAVLGRLLPAPHRLDRRAELVHLRAGVVVVVLALDVVARRLEEPRDRSRRTRRSAPRRR